MYIVWIQLKPSSERQNNNPSWSVRIQYCGAYLWGVACRKHVCSVGCVQWMVHWGCVCACVRRVSFMWLIKILNVRIVGCGYLNNAVFATADMEVYIALECSTTTYVMTASYSRLGNCRVFNDQCLLHVCIAISHMLLVHKECDHYCNKHDVTCYCSCSCFCALPP